MSYCINVWQKPCDGGTMISDVALLVSIDQWAWNINHWHIIKQILTSNIGQHAFLWIFGYKKYSCLRFIKRHIGPITGLYLYNICSMSNAHFNVNPVGASPRLTQEILMEKKFACQNPHPPISFYCQNPLPKDLYFYHL